MFSMIFSLNYRGRCCFGKKLVAMSEMLSVSRTMIFWDYSSMPIYNYSLG